jgi:exonuclease III
MIRSEWGYESYTAGGTTNSRGVAVLMNNNFDLKVRNIERDQTGNWIILDITMLDMDITLVCLYGPNDDRPDFYHQVKNNIEKFGNPHCMICGDYNLVQDQILDTFNYSNINNPKAKETVLQMKVDMGLCDPWRVLNKDTKRFTWRKNNPVKQARLDFFFISSEILNIIDQADILPGYRTDHSMVIIGLSKSNNIKRGRGSWKMNNDLLEDEEYVTLHHKRAVKSAFSLFQILNRQTRPKISFKMIYCMLILLVN